MVKVIGKDLNKVHKATCKSCASILEYTLSEIKKYRGTDWGGGPDGTDWIDCPSCGHQVILRSW